MRPVPEFQSDQSSETAGPFCRFAARVMSFLFGGLVPVVGFHLLASQIVEKLYLFFAEQELYFMLLNMMLFLFGGVTGLWVCFQTLTEMKGHSEEARK